MTDLQRAELAMVLQGLREMKAPKSSHSTERRLSNCETAIEQILEVLSQPQESGSKHEAR